MFKYFREMSYLSPTIPLCLSAYLSICPIYLSVCLSLSLSLHMWALPIVYLVEILQYTYPW
jgi:hypothetical protein